jgi:hypothetical protein
LGKKAIRIANLGTTYGLTLQRNFTPDTALGCELDSAIFSKSSSPNPALFAGFRILQMPSFFF